MAHPNYDSTASLAEHLVLGPLTISTCPCTDWCQSCENEGQDLLAADINLAALTEEEGRELCAVLTKMAIRLAQPNIGGRTDLGRT